VARSPGKGGVIEQNPGGAIVLSLDIFIKYKFELDNRNLVLYSYIQFGHIAGPGGRSLGGRFGLLPNQTQNVKERFGNEANQRP